jgi:glycine/D-amino acid oxidase-like deaminating enzyme
MRASVMQARQSTSSPKQTNNEPIAVIGAGLVGCMSAIYLAKAGYNVILLEKENDIMLGSSKIPVHLHSGGLYIKSKDNKLDMSDAYHCLHDSINFMKAMHFAVAQRPTAFAVMALDDKQELPNRKTQLLDEATDLYREDLRLELEKRKSTFSSNELYEQEKKNIATTEIPPSRVNDYKERALKLQHEKVHIMHEGFIALQKRYSEIIVHDQSKMVFGNPDQFFTFCPQDKFMQLRDIALQQPKLQSDPELDNKNGWLIQLARVTDPQMILCAIMSSELGLNMFRARAGIQLELDKLEGKGVTLLLQTKVNKIEPSDRGFVIKVEGDDPIEVSQVINATGFYGKDFDLQMGHELGWSVDVKGVGVVEFLNDEFDHTPEVYFTQAKGMGHIGRLNDRIAGVNFTTPYVEATYVSEGKQIFSAKQPVRLNPKLDSFLHLPVNSGELMDRAQACLKGCSRFMPTLQQSARPVAYLPGSLAIIGTDLTSRASQEVYISKNGYHAVNIIKGGGAVSAAMAVVHDVEACSSTRHGRSVSHFPEGSKSPIPHEFVLKCDLVYVNHKAKESAVKMNLLEDVGTQYRPTK